MSTTQFDGRPSGPDRSVSDLDTRSEVSGLPILPTLGEEAGFTLARLAVVVAFVIAADRLLHLSDQPAWAVLAAATVWALIPGGRLPTAVVGAGLAWLMGDGFLSHRFGEVAFGLLDQEHLAVLALAALVAVMVSRRAATVARMRGTRV
jgi:hypothetical protein